MIKTKCLDCRRTVPNGKLCICQSKNKELGAKFETILREAARKAVPIEDVRDALLEAIKEKPFNKIDKIMTAYLHINQQLDLPEEQWKHVSVTGWVKKSGKKYLVGDMRVYIDAQGLMRKKKWFEFWK